MSKVGVRQRLQSAYLVRRLFRLSFLMILLLQGRCSEGGEEVQTMVMGKYNLFRCHSFDPVTQQWPCCRS